MYPVQEQLGSEYVASLCPSELIILIEKYILKCESSDRPGLYLKLGATREAAEAAFAAKDMNMLRQIRDKSRNSSFVQEINDMMTKLGLSE